MNTKRILLVLVVIGAMVALAATVLAQSAEGAGPLGRGRLVGTWKVDVPESAGGLPPFEALHTYHADGTMTETTDLLGQLAEGPGHGVWRRAGNGYDVAFWLFVFDENGSPAGMVRVRSRVLLDSPDHLTGDAVVDFIEPDGTIIPNIDSTPFTGTRLKVEPVQ